MAECHQQINYDKMKIMIVYEIYIHTHARTLFLFPDPWREILIRKKIVFSSVAIHIATVSIYKSWELLPEHCYQVVIVGNKNRRAKSRPDMLVLKIYSARYVYCRFFSSGSALSEHGPSRQNQKFFFNIQNNLNNILAGFF